MTDIFISDLHLSDERPEIYRAFCRFLHDLGDEVQQLYILGDLFEVWVGDDDQRVLGLGVVAELRLLAQRRIRVFFQAGNRDFMLGKRFAKAADIELLPDYHIYEQGDRRILLMHGDLLCTDDLAYQKYRKRIQHPLVKGIANALPLSVRKKIGNDLRDQSQNKKNQKSMEIMDVTQSSVADTMDRFKVSTMIHGHTHRPNVHTFEMKGEEHNRYVLGDWHDKLWWITFDGSELSLNSEAII
jgi:UDP-2,3-diacylglucosamine hydrolase|tara:strand:+ start:32000 stop:32725 length:726 start_codon:yes stop_codon:yes gene_type:complete